MSVEDIIQTWKDPEYRAGGPAANHPAGEIALEQIDAGGAELNTTNSWQQNCTFTLFCCTVDAVWCPPQTFGQVICPILD